MTYPCVRCGKAAQHIGTSPAGADAYQCPVCDHVFFVAVKTPVGPPTSEPEGATA
jgi:DNA-directed RNA polymerase subunit RPC12/RpoP